MEGPALARRVHHVEHLGTLRLQAFKLALKSSRRYRREQLATYRVDDRESGSPEGVLDFTVSVRFHAVLHLIAAERRGEQPRRADASQRSAPARGSTPRCFAVRRAPGMP